MWRKNHPPNGPSTNSNNQWHESNISANRSASPEQGKYFESQSSPKRPISSEHARYKGSPSPARRRRPPEFICYGHLSPWKRDEPSEYSFYGSPSPVRSPVSTPAQALGNQSAAKRAPPPDATLDGHQTPKKRSDSPEYKFYGSPSHARPRGDTPEYTVTDSQSMGSPDCGREEGYIPEYARYGSQSPPLPPVNWDEQDFSAYYGSSSVGTNYGPPDYSWYGDQAANERQGDPSLWYGNQGEYMDYNYLWYGCHQSSLNYMATIDYTWYDNQNAATAAAHQECTWYQNQPPCSRSVSPESRWYQHQPNGMRQPGVPLSTWYRSRSPSRRPGTPRARNPDQMPVVRDHSPDVWFDTVPASSLPLSPEYKRRPSPSPPRRPVTPDKHWYGYGFGYGNGYSNQVPPGRCPPADYWYMRTDDPDRMWGESGSRPRRHESRSSACYQSNTPADRVAPPQSARYDNTSLSGRDWPQVRRRQRAVTPHVPSCNAPDAVRYREHCKRQASTHNLWPKETYSTGLNSTDGTHYQSQASLSRYATSDSGGQWYPSQTTSSKPISPYSPGFPSQTSSNLWYNSQTTGASQLYSSDSLMNQHYASQQPNNGGDAVLTHTGHQPAPAGQPNVGQGNLTYQGTTYPMQEATPDLGNILIQYQDLDPRLKYYPYWPSTYIPKPDIINWELVRVLVLSLLQMMDEKQKALADYLLEVEEWPMEKVLDCLQLEELGLSKAKLLEGKYLEALGWADESSKAQVKSAYPCRGFMGSSIWSQDPTQRTLAGIPVPWVTCH